MLGAMCWLFALAYASDLLGRKTSPADYVRDAIVFSVAIVALLGAIHALYPFACVLAALLLIVVRLIVVKDRRPFALVLDADSPGYSAAYALLLAATTAVVWPALVRPVLDGDSLLYHLPNAAAWVTAHSVWTASTLYWWYPPGSELSAAGIFAVGGAGALPLSGCLGVLLLGFRIVAFARAEGFTAWAAGAISAAIVTVPIVAFQAGTLQNDVWLAAWVLEIAWAVRRDRTSLIRCAAICAIIKPVGFLFAVFTCLWLGAGAAATTIAMVPLALWFVRDAVLLGAAVTSPAYAAVPRPFSTSIAGHGLVGIETLARAIVDQGLGFVTLALGIVALPFAKVSVRMWGLVMTLGALFLVEPFGFEGSAPQLATGASLRFLLPAAMVAIVGLLPTLKRAQTVAAVVAIVIAVANTWTVLAVFWNDASVRAAPEIAGIVLVGFLTISRVRRWEYAGLLTVVLGIVIGAHVSMQPARYYNAEIGSTRLFDWIEKVHPQRVVAWDLRSGMIAVVSPLTAVADASSRPCDQARHDRALLVVADQFSADPVAFRSRRGSARSCGRVLFEDESAMVVSPR